MMKASLFLVASLLLLALKTGDKAPDFTLKNQDGKAVKLSAQHGHPVLLYFYPKDETPGCTKEACVLRDVFKNFQKMGTVIYGVSTQDEKSHVAFRKAHQLPFDLLVDPKGETAKTFGVNFIPNTDLLERKSVLIDKDGNIFRVYENVDPAKHAEEVLTDLQTITKSKL